MGRRGEVAAIAGARKAARVRAHEGARDHARDAVVVDQLARNRAQRVQALEPEALLVRGDLEHAVGRGVDDGLAGAHVGLAQLGDDLRAGGVAVAQHAGQRRAPNQFFEQRRWKARLALAEVAPVEANRDARELPVAARRVLAAAQLGGVSVRADHGGGRVAARGQRARALAGRVHQTETGELGEPKRSAPTPLPRAERGDVTERVGAGIAKALGVGRRPDAEGVHHQHDGATHAALHPRQGPEPSDHSSPARVALIRFDRVPATTARRPRRAIS